MLPSGATTKSPLISGLRQTTIRTESPGVSEETSLEEEGVAWATRWTGKASVRKATRMIATSRIKLLRPAGEKGLSREKGQQPYLRRLQRWHNRGSVGRALHLWTLAHDLRQTQAYTSPTY